MMSVFTIYDVCFTLKQHIKDWTPFALLNKTCYQVFLKHKAKLALEIPWKIIKQFNTHQPVSYFKCTDCHQYKKFECQDCELDFRLPMCFSCDLYSCLECVDNIAYCEICNTAVHAYCQTDCDDCGQLSCSNCKIKCQHCKTSICNSDEHSAQTIEDTCKACMLKIVQCEVCDDYVVDLNKCIDCNKQCCKDCCDIMCDACDNIICSHNNHRNGEALLCSSCNYDPDEDNTLKVVIQQNEKNYMYTFNCRACKMRNVGSFVIDKHRRLGILDSTKKRIITIRKINATNEIEKRMRIHKQSKEHIVNYCKLVK
jgi:hypothetical protein